jgi:hypothetical protein
MGNNNAIILRGLWCGMLVSVNCLAARVRRFRISSAVPVTCPIDHSGGLEKFRISDSVLHTVVTGRALSYLVKHAGPSRGNLDLSNISNW